LFGTFSSPFSLQYEALSLELAAEGGGWRYRRSFGESTVERFLLGDGELVINPVEPLNTPSALTQNLLLELGQMVLLGPQEGHDLYLTFPVEVGVFGKHKHGRNLIDVFSLLPQKFTLYGTPSHGVICKYWKTPVHFELPEVNWGEGILKLNIKNETDEWQEITRAVFSAVGMRIYFREASIAMMARMKVTAKKMAETDFEDKPLVEGMTKSIEVYEHSKLAMTTRRKFVMEAGL
jgi:hypothetical protein